MTLLEALQRGLGEASAERFYHLARTCLVKDERYYDRFDRVFAAHFKGAEELFADAVARAAGRLAGENAGAGFHRRREGADRGPRRLGEAHGDAEEAPRGAAGAPPRRQQVDRHRRHLAVRRLRIQSRGRAHRAGGVPQPQRGQGLGQARIRQPRRHRGARHAQHEARAAPVAHDSRGAARRPNSRWPTPSMRPRVRAGGSTSRWCRSGTTS